MLHSTAGDGYMNKRENLLEIVGRENFSDTPEVLKSYSKDFSLVPSGMPNYVVKPKEASEVQKVIQFANEHLIPVVPISSGVHFQRATIPKQGGVVLDLTRMNRILEIDEFNRRVRIEAGVTWGQLTEELEKRGLRMIMGDARAFSSLRGLLWLKISSIEWRNFPLGMVTQ
jgi:glycolate oxidase